MLLKHHVLLRVTIEYY